LLSYEAIALNGIAVMSSTSFDRIYLHAIKPVIEKVYAFWQAMQAYEHLAREPFGKVLIKVVD